MTYLINTPALTSACPPAPPSCHPIIPAALRVARRMRALVLAALALATLAVTIPAAHAQSVNATGSWSRGDGGSHIRISRCGKSLCAVNTWVAKPGANGENVGDVLVMTLAPEAQNKLAGSAYDRQRKMSYDMTLQLSGAHMKTTGCVLSGIVCRSVDWNRLGGHAAAAGSIAPTRTANR